MRFGKEKVNVREGTYLQPGLNEMSISIILGQVPPFVILVENYINPSRHSLSIILSKTFYIFAPFGENEFSTFLPMY